MPSALPDGQPAPADGALPESAAIGSDTRAFGAYVHVPFCAVRCGYCDFNTYTAAELGGLSQGTYLEALEREVELAASVLTSAGVSARPLSTVFFGGGTPTLLPTRDITRILARLVDTFGRADGAEVTVEANPDSVDTNTFRELAAGGVTRVSIGMQSATPHVLDTLNRTHNPANVERAVTLAREAGLGVSLDVIYGTPGETEADWRATLNEVVRLKPDHVSAYALIVEPGTALARSISRGEIPAVDDDHQAALYEIADELLSQHGFNWYEVSNWALSEDTRSRHNLSYWTSEDWWGFGPGAHSHVGGVRWWNVKHPAAYAERAAEGSPAHAREILDASSREMERVLLESRIREGVEITPQMDSSKIARLIADELIEGQAALQGRAVLTLKGRLLADVVARELTTT